MTKKKRNILIIIGSILGFVALLAMILCIPRTGKPSTEIWDPNSTWDAKSIAHVDKTPGEDFKVLVITDIQLWTFAWDNREAWDIVDDIVEEEHPDLILLPGDNVSGLTTDMFTRDVVKHMNKYQVPWAPVNGNHDPEGNSTMEWQAEQYMKSPYCLMKKGPRNLYGCGNYFFTVNENDKPIYSFGMLDHGRYYDYGSDPRFEDRSVRETYMSYEQINWYEWNLKGIEKAYGTVPNMAVKHFAPPEFKDAIEKYARKGADGRYYVERGPENSKGQFGVGKGYGECAYLPSVAHINTGFVDMLERNGVTSHIIVGHDHENNAWITDDNGITYVYGLKTGPSPAFWNDAREYGCTMLTISTDEDGISVNIRNNVACKGKYAK